MLPSASELDRQREQIRSLSLDELRQAVAQTMDWSVWPGDGNAVLFLIETSGPRIDFFQMTGYWAVSYPGTNGSGFDPDFKTALFRAWLGSFL